MRIVVEINGAVGAVDDAHLVLGVSRAGLRVLGIGVLDRGLLGARRLEAGQASGNDSWKRQ